MNESKLSKDFLWFQFANPNYYKKIGHVMDGTGQKELSDKQILKLKIRLPRIETQNHIVETLSSAQRKIDLLKQLADKYKTQKRGLMQKMLRASGGCPQRSLISFQRTMRRMHNE